VRLSEAGNKTVPAASLTSKLANLQLFAYFCLVIVGITIVRKFANIYKLYPVPESATGVLSKNDHSY